MPGGTYDLSQGCFKPLEPAVNLGTSHTDKQSGERMSF